MRNCNLDLVEIDLMIFSIISKTLESSKENLKWLRSTAVVNPLAKRGDFTNEIRFKDKSLKSLEGYIVLCHYHPSIELRYLIKLELHRILDKDPEYFWLKSLVDYKSIFLHYIDETSSYSYRSFFGMINNKEFLLELQRNIKFVFKSNSLAKEPQFRRGYNDKGTLPLVDSSIRRQELQNDVNNLEEHLKLEQERQSSLDTISFLEGFLM